MSDNDQRSELVFPRAKVTSSQTRSLGVAHDVPLLSDIELEITMESGRVVRLFRPGHSLSLKVKESTELGLPQSNIWNSRVKASGGESTDLLDLGPAVDTRQWEIEITPKYAPIKEGHPAPEEESKLGETLSKVLIRGAPNYCLDE